MRIYLVFILVRKDWTVSLDLIPGAQGAAEYLGISRNAVYHLVNKGHLPVIRKGRSLYFRKSALEAAFDAEAQ